MINDTSMIRIRADLKADLKKRADNDGRTLEWTANKAIENYLLEYRARLEEPYVALVAGKEKIVHSAADTIPEFADPDVDAWAEKSKTPSEVNLERACCVAREPCKHWSFNGDIMNWTNSLSGRVREV